MSISRAPVAAVLAAAATLTGCAATTGSDTNPATDIPASASPAPTLATTAFTLTSSDGEPVKSKAPGGTALTVTVKGKQPLRATVKTPDGTEQAFTGAGKTLTSPILAPSTTYHVNVTNPTTGATTSRTITTGQAQHVATPTVSPASGTYGIGQTITATWPFPVKAADQDTFSNSLAVTGAAGTWRWTNKTTMVFRPATYWPGHTQITTVATPLAKPVTYNGTRWYPRSEPKTVSHWATGRALIVTIDAKRHKGNVTIDGKKVRSFGVSTGKSGYITRSGVKTITEKMRVQRMTNEGVTNDEVYDLQVPYAMRITSTGEFLHGAPWNGNIGYANTSHGCTNLTLSTAKWLFNKVRAGDVVVTTGTSRKMETWNGPGAVWNIPADKWAS